MMNPSGEEEPEELSAIPQQWPHVASLKPQLHRHIKAYPQVFRGSRWYILADAATSLGAQRPARSDILNILMQLHSISAMKSGIPTDVEQLFNRNQAEKSTQKLRRLMNPLAIRFPLIDPDNFLNRAMPHVRSLISIAGAVTWLIVISMALLLLLVHYGDLTYELKANVLSPQNILLMILIFPIMKTFHEFAHAFAVGMIAELFLAAIALILWVWLEPGMIRDAMLSAFLIGSVSTLLFNANPLLRFDGYYILQDLIEIPNLYTRSAKYNLYLIRKYLLGQDQTPTPATEYSERKWLAVYGVLALLYRIFITFVIALFLASKYLVLGVILAVWALTMMFIVPTYKAIRFLFTLHTNAEGIVWVPDQAQIYAETNGFVESQHGNSGTLIEPGASVISLVNADLEKTQICHHCRSNANLKY